jgi:hypothetical protein
MSLFESPFFKDAYAQLESSAAIMNMDPNVAERLKFQKEQCKFLFLFVLMMER